MDTTYVPTHLMYVERANGGWPKPVADDAEFKEWLIAKCNEQLGKLRKMSTREIYDEIRYSIRTPEDRVQYDKMGGLWDHILACVDRALRACDGRQVWAPERKTIADATVMDVSITFHWKCDRFKTLLPNELAAELQEKAAAIIGAKLMTSSLQEGTFPMQAEVSVEIQGKKTPKKGWKCYGEYTVMKQRVQ